MPKVSIAFGLINIPVKTETAARKDSISFNMLCPTCLGRSSQKLVCHTCNDRELKRDETVSGYEFKKGQFVTVTKEELKACEPDSNSVFEIELTVSAEEVDPLLFETSYYLTPDAGGAKGYALLLKALEEEGLYAIARATMSRREHVIIIRPYNGCLAFHTMFFASEVSAVPSLGLEAITLKEAELSLARQLLRVNAGPFEHGSYADGYQTRVEDLLQTKQAGATYEAPKKAEKKAEMGDLLEMLAASLKTKAA